MVPTSLAKRPHKGTKGLTTPTPCTPSVSLTHPTLARRLRCPRVFCAGMACRSSRTPAWASSRTPATASATPASRTARATPAQRASTLPPAPPAPSRSAWTSTTRPATRTRPCSSLPPAKLHNGCTVEKPHCYPGAASAAAALRRLVLWFRTSRQWQTLAGEASFGPVTICTADTDLLLHVQQTSLVLDLVWARLDT